MSTVNTSANPNRNLFRAGMCMLAACVLGAVLSACNTTEGVGKDIKSAGEGIEDTARDAKN